MLIRLALGSAPALVLCLLGAGVAAASAPELETDRDRYSERQAVRITLGNPTNQRLRFASPWRIKELSGDDVVARLFFDEQRQTLEPGGRRVFRWDQTRGASHRALLPPVAGGRSAGPGHFSVVAKTSKGRLTARFRIGQYFTIGFRHLPDAEFTLFATDRRPIRQMEAQLRLPDPLRDFKISGVVQEAAFYNPAWSYTMGSESILLGKNFIELCDASPEYVEQHLDSWAGERWCPWSSYVMRARR
jgi:hypothetical protein